MQYISLNIRSIANTKLAKVLTAVLYALLIFSGGGGGYIFSISDVISEFFVSAAPPTVLLRYF